MAPAGDASRPPAQITGGSQDKAAQMRVRSDDPRYLMHVDRWWNTLLPKVAHMTYQRGAGPGPGAFADCAAGRAAPATSWPSARSERACAPQVAPSLPLR
jgi:hypothetical protein